MYLVLSLRHLRVHATFTYNLTMFCILVSSLVPVLSILHYDGHPISQQLQAKQTVGQLSTSWSHSFL